MRISLIILSTATILSIGLATEPDSSKGGTSNSPILQILKAAFQSRKSIRGQVELFDVRPLFLNPDNAEKPNHYLVVARCKDSERTILSIYCDEIFGLFLFDDSLATVEHTIAFFPTLLSRDFIIKITNVWNDSVTVQGMVHDKPINFSKQFYLFK